MPDVIPPQIKGIVSTPLTTAEQDRQAALIACDRAALALAPDAHLASGKQHEDELRVRLAEEAVPLIQALGLIPYAAVKRNPNQGVDPVAHGTRSAVESHATKLPLRFCTPCQRWIAVHNRSGAVVIRETCGDRKACQAHYRDGEDLCVVCQAWSDLQHSRARVEPGFLCGTVNGARHHRDLGDPVCERCRDAEAARTSEIRQARADEGALR